MGYENLSIIEQSFTPADLLLISAIALVCAGVMRSYSHIIAAVVVAALVDFMMPGVYEFLTGASAEQALSASTTRLASFSGVAFVVRALAYFAAISILFGIKAAYGRR